MEACSCCFIELLRMFTYLSSALMDDPRLSLWSIVVTNLDFRTAAYILAEIYHQSRFWYLLLCLWADIRRTNLHILLGAT